MSNPYGENPYGDQPADSGNSPEESGQRPTPRYGQYASQSESGAAGQGGAGPSAGDGGSSGPSTDGTEQYPGTNPYGAPTWGQPDGGGASQYGTGQYGAPNNSPYGQQPAWSGAQAQQPAPPAGYAPAGYGHTAQQGMYPQKPKRPSTLLGAMYVLLAAGVAALVWGFTTMNRMTAVGLDDFLSQAEQEEFAQEFNRQMQMEPNAPDISPEEAMEMMLLGLGMIALIWAAILLAIYIMFAFVGTMTGNVGRILATIWVALSLFMLFLGIDGITFALIAAVVLLGVGAVVLMWLPTSNRFVAERRNYKLALKNPGYAGAYRGAEQYPSQYTQHQYGQDQSQQNWDQNNPYGR